MFNVNPSQREKNEAEWTFENRKAIISSSCWKLSTHKLKKIGEPHAQ